MTSVAGVPFQDLWAWKCPGFGCKVRLVRPDERALEIEAGDHWRSAHGELENQVALDFPPDDVAPLRAV
jgi:hypothetical protein